MNIAIVGYGLEGKSSYRYFNDLGYKITICDKDVSLVLPENTESKLGPTYLDNLGSFDLVVRSAGINPDLILNKNPGIEEKITSQLNEFLKVCPTKNIIGVTGTKGKGTTTTLIYKMLKRSGLEAILGGNIGVPFLSMLEEINQETHVVLELSSFQLCDLREKSPHIAVCLMVVPEHLNWHASLEEYYEAKTKLFDHQSDEDLAIFFAGNENSINIVNKSPGKKIPYFKDPGAYISNNKIRINDIEICDVNEVKLLGGHNLQNICAAVTASWQVTKDVDAIKETISSFSGLPHRIEIIGEINGVKYVNDSFATTPETTIAAIKSFKDNEILIIGGQPKNIGFDDLAEVITETNNIKKVIVIGEATPKIVKSLNKFECNNFVVSSAQNINEIMEEIDRQVSAIKHENQENLVVLYSPACTSFDMFKDYKDRGDQFRQAVQSLVSVAQ